jgi:hypothetical protein
MKTLTVAATLAASLALAPAAAAQSQVAGVGGGQTLLRLDAGTARALSNAGVRVSLVSPARASRSGIAFPVTGGEADPRTLAGAVEHSGGLRFRAGRRSVTLRDFRYTVGRRSSLSADVGGTRLTILSLGLGNARVRDAGAVETQVSNVTARLTAGAARALNRAFRTSLFAGGLRLGTVRSEVEFSDVIFRGGSTNFVFDDGAVAALQSLDITPSAIDPARPGAKGAAFPITGGRVDAETLAGEITHSGGLALTRGSTRVELREFTIGIDATPALSALLGSQRADILSLDVSGIRRAARGNDVHVDNVAARLTAGAADALNQAFGTTAFREGLTLGTAGVRGIAR